MQLLFMVCYQASFIESGAGLLKELFPKLHGHQQKSLALAVLGMVLADHAVLQRMAEEISLQQMSQAKMVSEVAHLGPIWAR